VPANSPLTDFNETSLVYSSKGWKGCNDYEGWATIIGKLAKLHPQVVAVNIGAPKGTQNTRSLY
jgi:hypothetical protein